MLEPCSEVKNSRLNVIGYGSDEYNQAAMLRYRLFYQEHNIPFASIFDSREQQDLHLAITAYETHRVLAYGRLGENGSNEFQIYQMVVVPECQGFGLGMRILQALMEAATEQGARLLTLNARVAKMQFYRKFGFRPVGEVFASSMTGVPHIKMQKELLE